jgi:uncharacterized membrane-anchored protein
MDVEEIVYTARDNTIELSLSTNGEAITHTGITRCQVKVNSTMLDSSVNQEYFDFSQADRIILSFGDAGLPAGIYTAKLYLFDINSFEGLFWGDFALTVTS